MGYIRRFFTIAVTVTVILYLINGLFAPAEAYYPELLLMIIPESLHKTMLWESVFLSNPQLWFLIGAVSAIIAAWTAKSFLS